jgi:hypothetical protein
VSLATSGLTRRGLNSLIILGGWTIWNHCNRCVFDGASPSMVEILILAGEERRQWMIAGAGGLIPFSSPPHRSVKSLGDMCMVVLIFCTGANVI